MAEPKPTLGSLALCLFVLGCAPEEGAQGPASSPPPSGPYLVAMGTAQDGGLPHAACSCSRCERARAEPGFRRRVASLALAVPAAGQFFLVDATPDIREQLDLVRALRGAPAGRVDRAPLDGVLLTHAHLGHYTGLAFFGFEAIHTRDLPVFASPSMAAYLRANGPWSQLVTLGNVRLTEIALLEPFALSRSLIVTPLAVPHRDEFSDTLGFVFAGPTRRVLYVPDTDSWRSWSPTLPARLEGIDVAILDGTFHSASELPGRDLATIGHPLMTETMDLLEPLVRAGKLEVRFTHMNHSNPALDPDGPERAEIERRGFGLLAEGQVLPL